MSILKQSLFLCLATAICAAATVPAWTQAPIKLHVDMETSSLVGLGSPPGPFYIDFQLVDGSFTLDGVNTVTLSNFQLGGGSPSGGTFLNGDAQGDLSSTVTLTDDFSIFNEFTQSFTPGNTLSFDATLTTTVDTGFTPDELSFAIMQQANNYSGYAEIPTLGPGDALLTVDLDGQPPTVNTYGSDLTRTDIDLPAPTAAIVPEAAGSAFSTYLVLAGTCLCLGIRLRRRD